MAAGKQSSTNASGKAQPPARRQGKAKASGEDAWSYPTRAEGTSLLTAQARQALAQAPAPTPKTPAKTKPQTKGKTKATPNTAVTLPTVQLGELNGEGLYEFTPQGPEPKAPVLVKHWRGYTLLSEHTRAAAFAAKLQRDVLGSGKYVLIDGVQYVLQDEAQ